MAQSNRDDALAILKRLREAGRVAYFAGGCVRDLLLGKAPKDYDVATDAPPGKVRELFRNTQAVGAAFGVILVRLGGSQIEVATFRADACYDDGRHPTSVRFTTAEEDAKRRDFTINGLFLDPAEDKVIDYVGGRADLEAKVVRAIGEPAARFDEDSLRLLRAVRFAARLGFEIEAGTFDAIRRHAPQLKRISPERIAEELRIMLTPPTRGRAWELLWGLGLLPVIFRFLVPKPGEAAGGPMVFPLIAEGQEIDFGLALAGAVVCYRLRTEEIDDPRVLFSAARVNAAVKAMRQALKISNEESEAMRGTLAGIEPLLADAEPGVARLKRFLAQPTQWGSRRLMAALAEVGICDTRIREVEGRLVELEKTEFAPAPLIDGDVLTELGLTPGPIFKRILDTVYDAQLEGRVAAREQAVEMAMGIAKGG